MYVGYCWCLCLHIHKSCFVVSADGTHHRWHRGPVRTVESLLLEGQVRLTDILE